VCAAAFIALLLPVGLELVLTPRVGSGRVCGCPAASVEPVVVDSYIDRMQAIGALCQNVAEHPV